MKSVIKNHRGLTLIEVIVVVGIMGVVAGGMSSLLLMQQKGQSGTRFRTEVENVQSEIRQTLGNRLACTATVGPIALAPATTYNINDVKNIAGIVSILKDTPLNDRAVIISDIKVTDYADTVALAGTARFTVTYKSPAEVLGPSTLMRTINLATKKDGLGKLASCNAAASDGGGGDIDGLSDGVYSASARHLFLGPDLGTSVTTGVDNIGIGTDSLANITTGSRNVALGNGAMLGKTGVSDSVAIGFQALYGGSTGTGNTAVGYHALFTNSGAVGDYNVGIGGDAGAQTNASSRNVFVGFFAGGQNAAGSDDNVGVGYAALAYGSSQGNVSIGSNSGSGLSGGSNVFIGHRVFFTNAGGASGPGNTIIGFEAAHNNITRTATDNTAIGKWTLSSISSGNQNTIVGTNSGNAISTGSNNILVGYNVQTPAAGTSSHLNIGNTIYGDISTRNVGIGITAPQTALQVAGVISPSATNTYTLGNASYRFTEVYATNGVINTSDRREKKEIANSDLGLDFINKLRPVSYRWNTGVDDVVHYGLIAQETEKVLAEVGKTDKTSLVTHDKTSDRYGVRYSEFISPLIKAVQELYNRVLGIDREIASMMAENSQIKAENKALKARLDQRDQQLQAIKQKLGLSPVQQR